jgi:hypothetical protein
MNCPNPTTTNCIKCNSAETNPDDPNYISDRGTIPDNVYYKCYDATYAEALADVVDEFAEGAAEAAGNSLKFVKNLPKYLLFVIPILVFLLGFGIIYKIFGNKSPEYKKFN